MGIITDIENDRRTYFKGVKPHPITLFASDEICFTAVRMSVTSMQSHRCYDKSGFTGFRVASYRPQADVFIFTDNKKLLATLNLVWGVRGFYYDRFVSTDDTFQDVVDMLKADGMVKEGEYVINCASMPIHKKQRTNTIKVTLVD
jgi:pyruvate kinase